MWISVTPPFGLFGLDPYLIVHFGTFWQAHKRKVGMISNTFFPLAGFFFLFNLRCLFLLFRASLLF